MNSIYLDLPLPKSPPAIRLLTLLPSPIVTSPLRCTLSIATLSSNPEYVALSYCWGNPAPSEILTVLSTSASQDEIGIDIAANLTSALWRLRDESQSLIFWVDAICIYSYRTATKCCRNLRFRPQHCGGFGFASHCLDSNSQKPVRAPGARFGSRLQLPTNPSVCAMRVHTSISPSLHRRHTDLLES
jgi:hypothetical protein